MRANRGRSRAAARRLTGAVVAVLLLFGMLATAPASADTKSELKAARARLAELEREIDGAGARLDALQQEMDDQRARLGSLQQDLNALAVKLDEAQNAYDATVGQVVETQGRIEDAQDRLAELQSRLDQRARSAYEDGPASSLGFILGSTSLTDLSDRLEFANELSRSDSALAADVQNRANDLAIQKAHLQDVQSQQAQALENLNDQKEALDAKFTEAQGIYEDIARNADEVDGLIGDLAAKRNEVDGLVANLQKKLKAEELAAAREAARRAREAQRKAEAARRDQDPGGGGGGGDAGGGGSAEGSPFSVCPVDNPRAYGDSFGAPRYAGGYHPHAGNDIMAPQGTIVRAPFSGNVEQDPNGLGGNAIIEYGSEGWIYGAHLSAYGATGSVSAGDVIGYVGNTGDAQGGPYHLHFEWHPDVIPADPYRSSYGYTVIGSAIDPYPYLNQVC